MKVLFVFGGLPHYFNKVMNRINEHPEMDVSVIAPLGKGSTIGSGVHESDKDIGFELTRLEEYNTFYGKPFFRGFYAAIKKIKPDVIVIGWPYFLAFVFKPLLLIRLKLAGIKLISKEIPFTVPAYNENITEFTNRCADSQKDEKIFHSKSVFRFHQLLRKYLYTFAFDHAVLYIESGIPIIRSYGLKEKNITVTFNSPDTDAIFKTLDDINSNHKIPVKDPYRLLHIGRLVKWKNVDLLIKAVDLLKEKYPRLNLCVIGKGEEENNLKNLVDDLHLSAQVKFLGAIYEGEDQSMEMLKSGIYVLAGMGGLSINEAMAHSLPVICTIADGTEQHLVIDGLNGFKFKDNDLNDLVLKIEQALHADRQKMGEASLKLIQEKYNIGTVANLYIKAFLLQKGQ
ncbi:MAG TPA: glycosyltransferase family 4 protein [Bacteroidia bacterium]